MHRSFFGFGRSLGGMQDLLACFSNHRLSDFLVRKNDMPTTPDTFHPPCQSKTGPFLLTCVSFAHTLSLTIVTLRSIFLSKELNVQADSEVLLVLIAIRLSGKRPVPAADEPFKMLK